MVHGPVDDRHSRDQELLRAYLRTCWVVPSLHVSFRLSDEHAVRGVLASLPSVTAVIITAWNPFSRPLELDENRARGAGLIRSLEEAGLPWVHCTGEACDGDTPEWSEESVLVPGITRDVAVRLGREWEQNSVAWLAARSGLVVCADGFANRRAGDFIPAP